MNTVFEPGDLVLVRNFSRRKLDPFYIGPFRIVQMNYNTACICDIYFFSRSLKNLRTIIPQLNLKEPLIIIA